MKLDLSILRAAPEYSTKALLSIDALAPLSMVAKMPGAYYRSLAVPSNWMLLGLLENALGWHFDSNVRSEIWGKLLKIHGEERQQSGVGFVSLLQHHVKIEVAQQPPVLRYDDMWIQHLRKRDGDHIKGSRHFDNRANSFADALADKKVKIGNNAGFRREPTLISNWKQNDEIHDTIPLHLYPRYYASNRTREYIVVARPYIFNLATSPTLLTLLQSALENPQAPLYLGANDGWVEAKLEAIHE